MKYIIFYFCILLTACGNSKLAAAKTRCDKFDEIPRIKCITATALEFNDPNTCNKINKQGERINCKRQIAVNTCDETICDTVEKTWLQEDCRFRVQESSNCMGQLAN